ncbi:hypothetical protein [Nocardiopsis alba]|uniref:hypothetical protein n=1 Tax=Nocardiopsis alba TaxID=53437 RepID=UPI0035D6F80D
MAHPEGSRPLNREERSLIERVLSEELPGAEELRGRVGRARVVASWGPRSPSVDLWVERGAPAAPIPSGVVPVSCSVVDEGDDLVGEILLWVDSGFLSGIEYAWYGDAPPTTLPTTDRLIFA